MTTQTDYDIIIAGGGMVGTLLAAALKKTSLNIAIIERSTPKSYTSKQAPDLRVSALSLASENMLRAVGAWEHLTSMRICPYRFMQVTDSHSNGKTLFDSHEVAEPHLGHIIENRLIQLALHQAIRVNPNVSLLMPKTIHDFEINEHEAAVKLNDGLTLTCKLLIGADGGNSFIRQQANIPEQAWNYQQHALVATIETLDEQQEITWQQFTDHGPLAFLPLAGNHGSLVWYDTEARIRELLTLSDEDFLTTVSTTFPNDLGAIQSLIGRASFPLRRMHAKQYVKSRLALIGDAAHTIHPLAGQGVNLGFLDAACLAEVLVGALNQGRDIGDLDILTIYEKQRRNENLLMQNTMEFFYRGFQPLPIPLAKLRGKLLDAPKYLPPITQHIMKHAMGLSNKTPRLGRGEIPSCTHATH